MAAPVLIDTDPGIDDALALLMGWSSPEISVEAVTTVAGNVPVEQGTVNVFRLLGLRKPTPRPVIAVGAAEPLARPLLTAQRYHGEDGLGDLDRKSTRLNSSHGYISYAVFCLKKKNKQSHRPVSLQPRD